MSSVSSRVLTNDGEGALINNGGIVCGSDGRVDLNLPGRSHPNATRSALGRNFGFSKLGSFSRFSNAYAFRPVGVTSPIGSYKFSYNDFFY